MNVSKSVTRFVVTAACLSVVVPFLSAGVANAKPPVAASPAPKASAKSMVKKSHKKSHKKTAPKMASKKP